MFYAGSERDPGHRSMDPVWQSAWFANYFSEWLQGITDIEYVKSQYDAGVAYSDVCLSHILSRLQGSSRGEETLILLTADHGEELDDHGCWFDHHGLYDTNVRVPLLLRFPDGRGAGRAFPQPVTLLDLAPTLLSSLGLDAIAEREGMEGRSLLPLLSQNGRMGEWENGGMGNAATSAGATPQHSNTPTLQHSDTPSQGVYLTECTWMRKRGWRTDEWKLIVALEADIYGKPPVELYNLREDPDEQHNLAEALPEQVALLRGEMEAWVARRLAETGLPDPSVAQSDALRIWQPRFIEGKKD